MTNTVYSHLYEVCEVVKFIKSITRIVVTRYQGQGLGNEELMFNGYRVSVWNDEILAVDGGDMNIFNAFNYNLKRLKR